MKMTLGARMKQYEDVNRYKLPHKSLVLFRCDGKAFHTYTKNLKRPFDDDLITDMDLTAIELCKHIQNAKFAYVQSDEISVFAHESELDTDPWFDNNIQKMASVSASVATAKFNQLRFHRAAFDEFCKENETRGADIRILLLLQKANLAHFDARVWTVPTVNEVVNYFTWRQRDATKNSISSVAQSLYSHQELNKKNSDQKQEMIWQKGLNWNDLATGLKRGRFIEKVPTQLEREVHIPTNGESVAVQVMRTNWKVVECPIFTQDRDFLLNRIKINY